MQITDNVQRAHERLLATLPVHTHLRADQPPRVWGGARVAKPSRGAQTRAAVLSLLKRGTPTRRIAVMLGISRTAVQKHMRAAGIKSLNKVGYSGSGVYGAR